MVGASKKLFMAATAARQNAHAPYSGFKVGAALLSARGEVFSGANVENASFGLTICAERSALCAAVSAGARDFDALLLVVDAAAPMAPCGACLQAIAEFAPDIEVLMATTSGILRRLRLGSLLRDPFCAGTGMAKPGASGRAEPGPKGRRRRKGNAGTGTG